MAKPSGLVTEQDRAIALRVRKVRFVNGLSQPDFARELGISLDRAASVEYGRTPLTVDLADRMASRFDVSLVWLAEGRGRMNPCVGLFRQDAPEIKANALLSQAYSTQIPERFKNGNLYRFYAMEAIMGGEAGLPKGQDADKYLEQFIHHLDEEFRAMPHSGKEKLLSLLVRTLARFSTDWELGWRTHPGEPEKESRPAKEKDILDVRGAADSVTGMKRRVPSWSQLRKMIAEQTSERGAKAALAKELGVSRQVLTNWLTAREQGAPNAELTLKLLAMFWKPAQ